MGRFTTYATTLVATLAATASSHMIMKTPSPIGTPDNSPLEPSGSNYPCKVQGDPQTFFSKGEVTKVKAGEKQTLSFTGSAVHGGGSCQLAITTDKVPNASTQWSVIQSIEGGCPSKTGDGPSEYEWTIPDSVPSGDYIFAWTWISKMSGAPELYMNCAKLQVSGGGNKRSLGTRAEDMPNLFVANVASVNSCKSRAGGASVDVQFPVPGPNVIRPGSNNAFAKPVGDMCFPKGGSAQGVLAGAAGTPSTGGGSDSSPAKPPSVTSSAAAQKPTASAPGGVFVTMPNGGGAGGAATTSASAAKPTTSAAKPTTSAAAPVKPKPSASSPAAPKPKPSAPAAPGAGTGSGSSKGAMSGPCTEEGTFNCVGQQYQQCASGRWSPLQAMSAGTKCEQGFSMSLWAPTRRLRRGVRAAPQQI